MINVNMKVEERSGETKLKRPIGDRRHVVTLSRQHHVPCARSADSSNALQAYAIDSRSSF